MGYCSAFCWSSSLGRRRRRRRRRWEEVALCNQRGKLTVNRHPSTLATILISGPIWCICRGKLRQQEVTLDHPGWWRSGSKEKWFLPHDDAMQPESFNSILPCVTSGTSLWPAIIYLASSSNVTSLHHRFSTLHSESDGKCKKKVRHNQTKLKSRRKN